MPSLSSARWRLLVFAGLIGWGACSGPSSCLLDNACTYRYSWGELHGRSVGRVGWLFGYAAIAHSSTLEFIEVENHAGDYRAFPVLHESDFHDPWDPADLIDGEYVLRLNGATTCEFRTGRIKS